MSDPSTFDWQILGGWLLLADMLLAAALFAFWEKAGRLRIRLGRSNGSRR